MPDDVKEVSRIDASARDVASTREALLKAMVISAREKTHVVPYQDEADARFSGVGAIEPPYDPTTLLLLLEHSNALRQCIDAYVTNIDAFGHLFEPIIDLDAADADDRVTTYIMERKLNNRPAVVANPEEQVVLPTSDEVAAAKRELAERMRAEKMKVQHFFDHACLDQSFVSLRRETRQDLEGQGNAYWEVVRDTSGRIAGFTYVPAFTVRHMKQDAHPVPVAVKVKVNEFDYGVIPTKRHFRRFVQVYETRVVFFKEFGDPRFVSALDGAAFETEEEWNRYLDGHRHASLATEMIHFRIHTAKSSYGIPRWIGTILSVLGSRQSEEVNLNYFENKSVPPLAVLVQGGRMTSESIERLKDFIENEIKGKQNFHKILVLEAESQGTGAFEQGRMKIDLKPLTAAQHNDALFQSYDQNNIDKIGQAFRLPRMLRGDIRDFNRATAEAALTFAEQQVFGPERDDFDFLINHKILPALGIRFWKFRSHTATTTDPQVLSDMIKNLSDAGVLVPAEGRELAAKVFNRELRKLSDPWTRQPLDLTKAGVAPPENPAAGGVSAAPAGTPTAGTPLGGAAMAPGAGAAGLAAASVSLTGTDAASVVTVNEARGSMGLGDLRLADGSPDPDGFLTVAEFKAKRMAAGQTQGTAEGQADAQADGAAPAGTGKDLGTGDLASGGALVPGQGRMRRLPPHYPNQGPGETKKEILSLAADLLTLRKTMHDLEVAEVEQSFREGLERAKRDEDPENGGPIEG